MKIIYELHPADPEANDKFELALIQHGFEMYKALSALQEYVRRIEKGFEDADREAILEYLKECLQSSKIHEIAE